MQDNQCFFIILHNSVLPITTSIPSLVFHLMTLTTETPKYGSVFKWPENYEFMILLNWLNCLQQTKLQRFECKNCMQTYNWMKRIHKVDNMQKHWQKLCTVQTKLSLCTYIRGIKVAEVLTFPSSRKCISMNNSSRLFWEEMKWQQMSFLEVAKDNASMS